MITFKGVYKQFGNVKTLRNINLEIPKGKTTVLIGSSGCGKSTLLRLIVGLIEPSAGDITFDGHPINEVDPLLMRRRAGYVIQDGGLFPHFTAEQNVLFMARHLKWDEDRMKARLYELCELTAFPLDRLKRYPIELSGGQQQRVSLMRALMLEPQVLLLDEPLGALDPLVRHSLQTDLKAIFEKLHKTVIMVTHDMGEAAYLGDQIVFMMGGRIVQKGSLDSILNHPEDPVVVEFLNAQRSLEVT